MWIDAPYIPAYNVITFEESIIPTMYITCSTGYVVGILQFLIGASTLERQLDLKELYILIADIMGLGHRSFPKQRFRVLRRNYPERAHGDAAKTPWQAKLEE
jgi:hypothetical protein